MVLGEDSHSILCNVKLFKRGVCTFDDLKLLALMEKLTHYFWTSAHLFCLEATPFGWVFFASASIRSRSMMMFLVNPGSDTLVALDGSARRKSNRFF